MHQVPTARGIKIRSAADAHLIFYAVHLGRLPMITRRLDTKEREEVTSGAVFVWEERSTTSVTGSPLKPGETDLSGTPGVVSGIERWTDGLKWGPSRVRDDFLFYQEKDSNEKESVISPPPVLVPGGANSLYRNPSRPSGRLIKQTYSVHYYPQILEGRPQAEPARKWHLTAYHSAASVDHLADVASVPELQNITPPEGLFKKARVGKKIPPSGGSSQSNVTSSSRNGHGGSKPSHSSTSPPDPHSLPLSSPPASYLSGSGIRPSPGYGDSNSVPGAGIVDAFAPPATNGEGSSHFQPRTPTMPSIHDSVHPDPYGYPTNYRPHGTVPPPPPSMASNYHYPYGSPDRSHSFSSSYGGETQPSSFPLRPVHLPQAQSNDPHPYQPYPNPSLSNHYSYSSHPPPQSHLHSTQPHPNGYEYPYARPTSRAPDGSPSSTPIHESHPNGIRADGSPYSTMNSGHHHSYDTYPHPSYHGHHPSGSQSSTGIVPSPRQRHSVPTSFGYPNGDTANPHHARSGSYPYPVITGAGGAIQQQAPPPPPQSQPTYMTPPPPTSQPTYVTNPGHQTYMTPPPPPPPQAQQGPYGTPRMMVGTPNGAANNTATPPNVNVGPSTMTAPNGVRSPPTGVIRNRRGTRKNDENTSSQQQQHQSQSQQPSDGPSGYSSTFGQHPRPSVGGDTKQERGLHFSPYERPPNVPGPRQHPAIASSSSLTSESASTSATNGEANSGGHFVPPHPHPHQQPGPPPISAHSRRGSYHQYPQQQQHPVPGYGNAPPVPPLPPQTGHPPQPPAQPPTGPVYHYTNGGPPSGTSRGSISTGIGESSPTTYGSFDFTPGTGGAASGSSHTWTNPSLHSSQSQEQGSSQSFQYGGSEFPAGNAPSSIPFQGHTMIPSAATGSESTTGASYGDGMSTLEEGVGGRFGGAGGGGTTSSHPYPSHMAPHLHPDHSPPMAAFRPRSGTYPEESSFGGASGGGDAGSVTSHHSVNGRSTYGYESNVAEANASRGAPARAPPKLDIALATAMTTSGTGTHPAAQTSAGASKSGSLSSTTASKLGPLTPSLSIHTRDPEDERVLDLLSRSTPSTAVAVGTGAPTATTAATGIPSSGSASGSVHGGSVRAGSVGSVVNLANGKRSSFDGEVAAFVASIGGD